MLGTSDYRQLKLYAAESNGYLHFTTRLLQQYGHLLGDRLPATQECQARLVELHLLFRKHSMRLPLGDADRLCAAANAVVRIWRDLGIHETPKLHMIAHYAYYGYHRGAPALWACWADEMLNQTLKRVSCAAHSTVWHERVLDTLGNRLHELAWGKRGAKRLMVSA